jgi:hypothetical protein
MNFLRWLYSWKYDVTVEIKFLCIGPLLIPLLPRILEFRLYQEWPKW